MTASLIRRVTLIGLLACVVPSPFPAVAAALDRPGYLAIADRLQAQLGPYFNETLGRYDPGRGGTTAEVNADLLLVHAAAALQGHDGPSRDDRKARLVARFLVGPDAWTEAPLPDHAVARGLHGPAWRASPDHYDVHMVFVTEVAEALAIAYRARAELGLDDDTVARIRDELARVAGSSDISRVSWPLAPAPPRRRATSAPGWDCTISRRGRLEVPPTSARRSTPTSCSASRATTVRPVAPGCLRRS